MLDKISFRGRTELCKASWQSPHCRFENKNKSKFVHSWLEKIIEENIYVNQINYYERSSSVMLCLYVGWLG